MIKLELSRRSHARMLFSMVEFTTEYHRYSCFSNPAHGEVYTIQIYVKRFVSDLRQVGGFLRVLWFPVLRERFY